MLSGGIIYCPSSVVFNGSIIYLPTLVVSGSVIQPSRPSHWWLVGVIFTPIGGHWLCFYQILPIPHWWWVPPNISGQWLLTWSQTSMTLFPHTPIWKGLHVLLCRRQHACWLLNIPLKEALRTALCFRCMLCLVKSKALRFIFLPVEKNASDSFM